jgi:hypothetical protein
MSTVERINEQTRMLPEVYQLEVLDFVEFLINKTMPKKESDVRREEREWQNFSLSQAMRGIEDDDIPEYTESDLIEKWRRWFPGLRYIPS